MIRQAGIVWLLALISVLLVQDAIGAQSNPGQDEQIVFGMAWEPVGFFPIRAIDSGSYYAQTLVYEGLVKYDSQIKIVPALAEKYTISGGGLDYQFTLRKNLHFSDGTPITLKDVEASFKIATGPDSPFKGDYSNIASFAVSGDYSFVVHLTSPNAALLSRFVELRILPARLIALPDRGRSILSRTPISSGPFCLAKWESGLELTFTPNPYYWGEKPRVRRLIWRVIPDKSLLALSLCRHEIDVAQIDPSSWKPIAAQSGIVLDRFAGSRTMYLGFNLAKEPFKELPLRQAIGVAINRQAIVDQLLGGLARVPASDVPSGSWVFDGQVKPSPFDRQLASRLLAEFEKTTPFKQVAFRILAVRDHLDIAQAVACDLREIGIKNEVQLVEFSTLRRRYLQPGKFDVVIWSRSSGPDPECGIVWGSHGPLNFCRYENPKIDLLLKSGRRAMDPQERAAIYKEIQAILAMDLPWIFLCQADLLLAHSRNCQNMSLGNQAATGLPWDNPLFNAAAWQHVRDVAK